MKFSETPMAEARIFRGTEIPADRFNSVIECLHHGDKLNAIRYVREGTNLGLLESRQIVDDIAADAKIEAPYIPEYDLVRDFHFIQTTGRLKDRDGLENVRDWMRVRCDFYVRQGLVEESKAGYRLTPQGHALITRIFAPDRPLNQVIDFASCFLSHSTKDGEFVSHLYDRLTEVGVRAWYAPHDIAPGEHLDRQLDDAIKVNDRMLLVLSARSIKSNWVQREILTARKRERSEKRRILFPISLVSHNILKKWACLDPDTGEDLAMEIRRFYIPSFSAWNDTAEFDANFERLLAALRQERSAGVNESYR